MNRVLKQRFNQISRQKGYLLASRTAAASRPATADTTDKQAPIRAHLQASRDAQRL